MELRHLRYFVAVAEELNVRRAAERLHVSQPPLSRQIHDLEDEVGVKLLIRSRRGVELTEAGRFFLAESRQILEQGQRAITLAKAAGRGEAGRLVVAYTASLFDPDFSAAVRKFKHRFPLVDMEFRELTPYQQIQELSGRQIDLAYVPFRFPELEQEMAFECVREVATCAVLPQGHPLAKKERLSPRDLAGEPFVFPRFTMPSVRAWYFDLCRTAGFIPRIVQEADNPLSVLGLVSVGVGVTFSSEAQSIFRSMGLIFRSLPRGTPKFKLHLMWRRDNPSPVLQSFVAIVRDHMRALRHRAAR
ncbi:MAG TPA: LysR substrate-binding domain-containing protein [Opitutales bacterium]|nr:LysR substrate-binding domain-containing protein [Opitutales bacterium]